MTHTSNIKISGLMARLCVVALVAAQTLSAQACSRDEGSERPSGAGATTEQGTTAVTTQPASPAQPMTARQWNEGVVGWNLGNQLECTPPGVDSESFALHDPEGADQAETGWGNPVVTRKLLRAVKEAGFNAVRIPVRWQCHISNEKAMSISPRWLARVKEVVDWCLAEDLKVVINTHHDKWLEGRPTAAYKEENCRRLALLWSNIATAFRGYDYRLAFAGTNEVHVRDLWGKPTAENLDVQNAYNQTFVSVVRATGGNNAQRHLMVQTYVCNPEFGLDGGLIVPQDAEGNGNRYMSVEFHFYNPWTYAGGTTYYYWGAPYQAKGQTPPENEQTITTIFDKAALQWAAQDLGVVIGEWGISDHYKAGQEADIHANMTYYCQFYLKQALRRGFATFYWDNNVFGSGEEKFGVFDRHHGMKLKAPWIMEGIRRGSNR